jgi:hypothetical protein
MANMYRVPELCCGGNVLHMDTILNFISHPVRGADIASIALRTRDGIRCSLGREHTRFVLPSVGRLSQTSFRQVFSRNPVFLNQTTGARSWIPAQKRRRNDETGDHPFLSTNGVCSRWDCWGFCSPPFWHIQVKCCTPLVCGRLQ